MQLSIDITDLINEIREIKALLNKLSNSVNERPEKLLSPAETCKLFQPSITKVTLASWTNKGLLTDYRIGGRVFYKESEIMQKLFSLKKYHGYWDDDYRKQYKKNQADNLDDSYVKGQLKKSGFTAAEIVENPIVIDLKRTQLSVKREIKKQK